MSRAGRTPDAFRRRNGILAAILIVAGLGCAPPRTSPPPSGAAAPSVALPARPLLEHFPAAGLRWLLVLRPSRIAGEPAIASDLARIVPPRRLAAFAQATGIQLENLPLAAVAGYGGGVLYAAEVSAAEAAATEELFRARLRHGGVRAASRDVRRVVGTTAQGDVVALVVASGRVVVLATGDVTLARAAEGLARRALRSPPALEGAALSALPRLDDDVIAAFYAPGPFERAWDGQGASLLGSATAVGIVARGRTVQHLDAKVLLAGSWSAESGDGEALEATWAALRGSETGQILGLGMADSTRVEVSPELLSLSTGLSTGLLLQGLYKLTSANVWEILDLPPPAPDASRAVPPTQSASQPESAAISGP